MKQCSPQIWHLYGKVARSKAFAERKTYVLFAVCPKSCSRHTKHIARWKKFSFSFNKCLFYLCSLPEQAVGCYCCLLEQERSPEQPDADGNGYVICFMGGSEKGLNLYPCFFYGISKSYNKASRFYCIHIIQILLNSVQFFDLNYI